MSRLLNRGSEATVAELVEDILNDQGFDEPELAIPGLVRAIWNIAEKSPHATDVLLDEAADLLADGPERESV